MKQSPPKPKHSDTYIHQRLVPAYRREDFDGSEPVGVEE